MFGFVVANLDALDAKDKEWYRACYCGLCRALGERHGLACRAALTYDMAFLALLLSSYDSRPPKPVSFRCPLHPLKERTAWRTVHTDYAADMNVLLAHRQRMDRWSDDRSAPALAQARLLGRRAADVAGRYPKQCRALDEGLRELARCEREGELNPDLPAEVFGVITGEVFVAPHRAEDPALRAFGEALGRFVYIMDAAVDLKRDVRKKRYNPLVAVPTGRHEEILAMMMSACTSRFETLNILRDKALMENILYSGIWTRFRSRRGRGVRA